VHLRVFRARAIELGIKYNGTAKVYSMRHVLKRIRYLAKVEKLWVNVKFGTDTGSIMCSISHGDDLHTVMKEMISHIWLAC
jgi:hypothetical protein